MRALGSAADTDGACYLTGGATAVLYGWREATIDVDIRLVPETEALLRALQLLKDELQINVELASPADFITIPPGWEDRGVFVAREGKADLLPLRSLRAGARKDRTRALAGSRGCGRAARAGTRTSRGCPRPLRAHRAGALSLSADRPGRVQTTGGGGPRTDWPLDLRDGH